MIHFTGTSTFYFAFRFFHASLLLLSSEVPHTICNDSLIIYLPQTGEIWTKLNDPKYTKFGAFWRRAVYMLTISDILLEPFKKRFLQVKHLNIAITRFPFFILPNYGSPTSEIKLKVIVYMEDLAYLMWTFLLKYFHYISSYSLIYNRENK